MNYSLKSWKVFLKKIGLEPERIILTSVKLKLNDWMTTSGTPDQVRKELTQIWNNVDEPTKEYFKINKDNNQTFNFEWPCAVMIIKKQKLS